MAAVYEILGEVFFKIRAYRNATDAVDQSDELIKDVWDRGGLQKIPGIGASIAQHIDEIFRTGKSKHIEMVLAKVPSSVFKLLEIPGVGPKTAGKLVFELRLSNPDTVLDDLVKAGNENKIANIEGFGEKSQKEIIEAIARYKKTSKQEKRKLLAQAIPISESLISYMKKCGYVIEIEALGSLRRGKSTVGDLDFAVVTESPKAVIERFVNWDERQKILASGENTARTVHKSGIQIDIKTSTRDKYGSMLQHFTGSKEHNVALREYARSIGLSLSEKGIKDSVGKLIKYSSEKEFYRGLGMDFIPPEMRENKGEIELALAHKIPKLVKLEDVKGDLHIHSNFPIEPSHDLGLDTMEIVVRRAEELNYEYVAFSEHNPKKGLSSSEKLGLITAKKEKINSLKTNVAVFNSLEIDILPDGSLPLDNDTLEGLDFAIVSLHSSFRQSKSDMTKRILRGLAHPKTKVLGHPTARLIQSREGVEADWQQIFIFCAEHGKALEINASGDRLDLPEDLAKIAGEYRVMFALGTDSHSVNGLSNMHFAVSVARRAWIESYDIINTWSLPKFREWVYDRR